MSPIILIAIFVIVIAFGLLFMIVRRALRLAFRLALVGLFLLALLVGALAWWYYSPLQSGQPQRPSPARPTPRAR